jgi:hypothetical protein
MGIDRLSCVTVVSLSFVTQSWFVVAVVVGSGGFKWCSLDFFLFFFGWDLSRASRW